MINKAKTKLTVIYSANTNVRIKMLSQTQKLRMDLYTKDNVSGEAGLKQQWKEGFV